MLWGGDPTVAIVMEMTKMVTAHFILEDAAARLATVERHLRKRLSGLSDGRGNEDDREIIRKARALVGGVEEKRIGCLGWQTDGGLHPPAILFGLTKARCDRMLLLPDGSVSL